MTIIEGKVITVVDSDQNKTIVVLVSNKLQENKEFENIQIIANNQSSLPDINRGDMVEITIEKKEISK